MLLLCSYDSALTQAVVRWRALRPLTRMHAYMVGSPLLPLANQDIVLIDATSLSESELILYIGGVLVPSVDEQAHVVAGAIFGGMPHCAEKSACHTDRAPADGDSALSADRMEQPMLLASVYDDDMKQRYYTDMPPVPPGWMVAHGHIARFDDADTMRPHAPRHNDTPDAPHGRDSHCALPRMSAHFYRSVWGRLAPHQIIGASLSARHVVDAATSHGARRHEHHRRFNDHLSTLIALAAGQLELQKTMTALTGEERACVHQTARRLSLTAYNSHALMRRVTAYKAHHQFPRALLESAINYERLCADLHDAITQ